MDDRLMAAVQASIARTDELHAQHVAELERTIAGLHEVLVLVSRMSDDVTTRAQQGHAAEGASRRR